VTEIMPVYGAKGTWTWTRRAWRPPAALAGAGAGRGATKVELVRAFVGDVAKTIVEVARDHGAGVVVLGCRGRGDLTALLLGSVGHKVIHLADRPVLVVR
jgi:nucleotide-binding universal stress UspA family protein